MTTCAVRGCNKTATEIFTPEDPDLPAMEWLVCEDHGLELKVSPWRADMKAHELIVGADGPPSVINFKIHTTIGGSTLELVLGHDGVEEQTIECLMDRETARGICNWLGDGDHDDVP